MLLSSVELLNVMNFHFGKEVNKRLLWGYDCFAWWSTCLSISRKDENIFVFSKKKFLFSVPSLNLLKSHSNHCRDSGGDVFANHELRDNEINMATDMPGVTNRWNRWSIKIDINWWQSISINRLILIIDDQSMKKIFVTLSIGIDCYRLASIVIDCISIITMQFLKRWRHAIA